MVIRLALIFELAPPKRSPAPGLTDQPPSTAGRKDSLPGPGPARCLASTRSVLRLAGGRAR